MIGDVFKLFRKKKFMELLLKFIFGGGLIVLISLLAKSKNPQLAGLAVLFPIVTLVGYFFIINSIGKVNARPIILFSIIALPTVLAFLITLYFSLKHFNIYYSFSLSILAWLIVAILVFYLDKHFFHLYK